LFSTFERWGISTLGDLGALPAAELLARLGEAGVRWWRRARGEDDRPLIRDSEEERFDETLELEWPIEGLEPLSFVLARLLEPLSERLERCDRGAVTLRLWLKLVSRDVHHRSLQLPVPMRDPKLLRTLLLLDLESHPPSAGIDRVTIAVDPAPGRIVQFSMLARPLPTPDQVSTLTARLAALMGEGRCGAPALVDTHRPGAFEMSHFSPAEPIARAATFDPGDASPGVEPAGLPPALRRFRHVVTAQVALAQGRPVRVTTRHAGLSGGAVTRAAGPWRTSGEWWKTGRTVESGAWDHDEWDVALADGAVYRIHRNRVTDCWFVEGIWD
jgi:protein ImuB